jgi:adenine-specific DNA methylase
LSRELHAARLLVEDALPLGKGNETARIEASFIRAPKLSNLHPYLARRPTAPARILTLASVLPREVSRDDFERALGLDKVDSAPYGLLYLINPDRPYVRELIKKYTGREPKEIVVVDPMAGGGSIPLEALRLGFHTVAADYNPVAYLILKATLEYPSKYGAKLYEDVKKEVEELIGWAKEELTQYYAQDAFNYVVARGYRCPNPACRGLVPIIHSSKMGGEGPYVNLVVDKAKRSFTVEVSGSEAPFERLKCPYCGAPMSEDVALRSWVKRHKELLEVALGGDVDRAKSKVEELLEVHIPLVKETPQGFRPADDSDSEIFVKAFLDLAARINELKDLLPDAQIPKENEVFEPIRDLGIEYWYELFNPRQLLILLKLMDYVRKRAEILIKKMKEYGASIALYLALGLDKLADYNNVATEWDASQGSIDRLAGRYQNQGRRVGLGLEYCEAKRTDEALKWVFEPHVTSVGRTAGGILPLLRLLSEWLEGLSDRVEVLCSDARKLEALLRDRRIEGVDIVNVDPPYLAQHFYSDLMEFYWQFLRITLRPAIDSGYLFNRDPTRGKVELYVDGWSPLLSTLPREAEIIARRGKDKIAELGRSPEVVEKEPFTGEWYALKTWEFFEEVNRVLKDDGVLVVWFTHSDPRAWEAVTASLYAAGFALSKAWPMWTEMGTRVVALLTSAFFTSLVLVLRKRGVVENVITGIKGTEELIRDEGVRRSIKWSVIESVASALNSGASGSEAFIMGLAGGIAGATRIWNPIINELDLSEQKTLTEYIAGITLGGPSRSRFKKAVRFFDDVLYPAAMYLASEALLEDYLMKCGLDERMSRDALSTDAFTRAYLTMWIASRYAGGRELAYDFIEKVCKIFNVDLRVLALCGLVAKPSRPSKSAKQYKLLFGSESYEAVKGKAGELIRTTAGRAIHLLRLIGEGPRDDASKAVKEVLSSMPVSRGAAATALLLLRTAGEEELRLVKLSEAIRGFAEDVLLRLYRGV